MEKYAILAVIGIGTLSTILMMLAFAGFIPQANSEALMSISFVCLTILFLAWMSQQ